MRNLRYKLIEWLAHEEMIILNTVFYGETNIRPAFKPVGGLVCNNTFKGLVSFNPFELKNITDEPIFINV